MKKISIFLMMLCLACFGVASAQQTQNLLTEDFSSMSSIATTYSATDWYAYNAGNGNNWVLNSGTARYNYSSSYAANCYLVSAPFSVSADMMELSVSLAENTGSYSETFEVFFVKASDVTSDAAIVSATHYNAIASATYTNTTAATVSGSVTAAALAGQSVRVVVHCTSAADMFYLTVDDINVTETVRPQGPYIMLNPTEETVFTGFNTTLTATYGNVTNPTITYSSSNTSVATVSGSGTTVTVTGVSAGTATITATMNGSYTATCAITVEDPSYCTPGTGGYDNNGISNVTFGMGPIVNNTVGGINYGDYSNLVGGMNTGATCQVDITYKTGYTYGTIIWVDWNQNYTFEGTEAVYAGQSGSDNPTTLNATFTVPATAQAGDYRMRIIGSDSGLDSYTGSLSAAANADPCGSYSYSTCHDYTLRVGSNPYIALNPSAATVFTGFTETLTATYGNVSGTPTITYSSSNTSVATVSGSGTTATVTAVAPGTATITATMNGSYTATCTITVEDPSYCTPNPSSRDGKGITTLTFGSGDYVVNNSNSNGLPASSPYYGDYTSMVGSSEAGETVTVSITYSTGDYTVYSYGTIIWVDWNKNYEFEDSEIVYTGTSAQGSGGTPQVLTATFNVPGNQAADDYRMRIAGADSYFDSYIGGNTSANHSPCFSSSYAVCHDYTLRVVVANPCGMPTNLQASQVGTTTAHLSWDGSNDSYALQYRTAATDMNMGVWEQQGNDIEAPAEFTQLTFDLSDYSGTGYIAIRHYACSGQWQMTIDDVVVTNANNETVFSEDFNSGSFASSCTNLDYDGDGYSWQIADFGDDAGCQHGAYCLMSASYASGADLYPDNWFIISNVALGGTLTFYVASTDADWPENFGVFVATSSYEGVPAGAWSSEIPVATTSYDLTGLTANTAYEWQVKGICNGYPDPSNWASSTFTTIAEGFKTFITEGYWDVANNWFPAGVPAITDEVSIEAPVTIPAGVVATAKKATLNGGSVLIKDGGQLKQGSYTLKVTMEKDITGYGESTNKDHYYFIATPLTGTTQLGYTSSWNYVTNVNVGDYDFYWFDATYAHEEWQNYEALSDASDFVINPGVGYLYANKADKTLQFVGTIKGFNIPTTISIPYDENSTTPFNGWSLVGNPYSCNAYLSYVDANDNVLTADFYVMNTNGDGYNLLSSSNGLAPLTGALISYSATGKVQFATEAPTNGKGGMLNMNLSQGRGSIDQARIRFGQGHNLKHMSFRNSSKLYMPVEGNDFAVVYAENEGEMPVSFKAEKNGSYTISFNTENVEFSYLHLIDNMTGNDVDLLSTPSYSFEAKTTDYASRFKLVFNASANDDSFAFFNGSEWVINNEGQATLQVIDIMGRVISSETINGNANVNVNEAAGVYMLRLINGDNVKVQKVVVR